MVRVPTMKVARHRSRRAPQRAARGGGLVIAGIGRIYLWNGGSL